MPRKPTGRPTGRPPGSGRLGEIQRLSLRIPTELYARLEAFAEGRSSTRGTPQLAGSVRALLEHALACPYKRQTKSIPPPESARERQTESTPSPYGYTLRQTESTPPVVLDTEAIALSPEPVAIARQPVAPGPAFDPHKYKLGSPCKAAGHLSHGEAGNLRGMISGVCLACADEKKATKAKATRPAPVTKEE